MSFFFLCVNSPCCNKDKLDNVNLEKMYSCHEKGMGNIETCFPGYTKGCILNINPYSINQFPGY